MHKYTHIFGVLNILAVVITLISVEDVTIEMVLNGTAILVFAYAAVLLLTSLSFSFLRRISAPLLHLGTGLYLIVLPYTVLLSLVTLAQGLLGYSMLDFGIPLRTLFFASIPIVTGLVFRRIRRP